MRSQQSGNDCHGEYLVVHSAPLSSRKDSFEHLIISLRNVATSGSVQSAFIRVREYCPLYSAILNVPVHEYRFSRPLLLSVHIPIFPSSLQAVSPNKRYAALADKGEKPTVTVFDLHTLRKRKVLSFAELQAQEYVSVAFSPDSKYLIAQGGGPDWTLVYWGWEKAKLMASLKPTTQSNSRGHGGRGGGGGGGGVGG